MSYKVLEQNGVWNENIDGAAFNNFCAKNMDGIIGGILEECPMYLSSSNIISIGSGLLIIKGFRVKILEDGLHFSMPSGITPGVVQIICSLTLNKDRSVLTKIFLSEETALKKDNILIEEEGKYEIEIGRFYWDGSSAKDLTRSISVISVDQQAGENIELAQTLEGNEEDKAPSVKAVNGGLDGLGGRIARNDKRLTNIEQGIPPELFETDSSVAYEKDIPEKALPYAEISKIGGMTYKDGSTLKSAKVTEIASVGVNLIDLKDMPIAGSNRFDIPITVTEGKYWLSIFNSDGTGDGWSRGNNYSARFVHDDENIVLSVDYGGVVTKEQAAQINKFRIFIVPDHYTGTASTFTAMLNKGETHAPLTPFFKRTLTIPEAVQDIEGYGESDPENPADYNYIDFDGFFVCKGHIVDGAWVAYEQVQKTNISHLLPSDNFIEVEGGGTITAVNENGFAVPSEITYMLEEETV